MHTIATIWCVPRLAVRLVVGCVSTLSLRVATFLTLIGVDRHCGHVCQLLVLLWLLVQGNCGVKCEVLRLDVRFLP